MTQYLGSLCFICKHFRGLENADGIISGRLVCDAYPHGAPKKFLGRYEHLKPEPGDNGIQFEPTSLEALRLFRTSWPERPVPG